jgi:hypothetical protein
MKVRVTYRSPQMSVDEVFVGDTPDAVVSGMQKAVAAKVNFAVRILVNSLSPLQFAQEVVKRYNEASGKSVPPPRSCAEFLQLGEVEGLATVLEA